MVFDFILLFPSSLFDSLLLIIEIFKTWDAQNKIFIIGYRGRIKLIKALKKI